MYEVYVSILVDSDLFVFFWVDSLEEYSVKEAVVEKLLPNADANRMKSKELKSNGFSMKSVKMPDDVFAYKMQIDDLGAILQSQ